MRKKGSVVIDKVNTNEKRIFLDEKNTAIIAVDRNN